MVNKTKKSLEEWTDNDTNQAKVKEKAVIFYSARKKTDTADKIIDNLVNYCNINNLEIINTFNVISSTTKGFKKNLYEMINFVREKKNKIHVVCDIIDDICMDFEDLSVLLSLIKDKKIVIHLLKEKLILDKNSLNGEMLTYMNLTIMSRKTYINSLSYKIKRAKSLAKSSCEYKQD